MCDMRRLEVTTPVDLDELERIVAVGNGFDGGAFAAVPTTKLRALITELRAVRASMGDGVVTREHRMWAIACLEEWPFGVLTPDHKAWLDSQPTIGDYHVEELIAKAIADAEARGAARTPPAELDADKREAAWARYVATKHATLRDTERDTFAFAYEAGVSELTAEVERLRAEVARLNPYAAMHDGTPPPSEQPSKFISGVRYYLGMLEDAGNWPHELGHIEELCAEFQTAIDERAGKAPPLDAVAGLLDDVSHARTTVGHFNQTGKEALDRIEAYLRSK